MLATLNLQLATTDLSAESLPLQDFSPVDGATKAGGFAEMLDLRMESLPQQPVMDGQVLPPDGSKLPLPEPDIAITVDDLPVPSTTATAAPDVDTLVSPAPAETQQVELEPLLDAEQLQVDLPVGDKILPGPVLPAVVPGPVTAAPPADDAQPGQAAEQLRDVLAGSRQQPRAELAPSQAEVRSIVSGERVMQPVPPGAIAERQSIAPRRTNDVLTNGDAVNKLADNQGRHPPGPVAAPIVEQMAEVMRTRVRPGRSVTAAAGQAQPATAQPLVTGNPVSNSNFAGALQQQTTDLIRTPVSEPAWGDRIGERVVVLAGNQVKTAEIRLTPAELGPVRVQVSVEEGATNVTFQAQHAVTRDALEQALPRLREMLAENGLSLGQADVGEHGVEQGNRDGDTEDSSKTSLSADESGASVGDSDLPEARTAVTSNGLVDTFA